MSRGTHLSGVGFLDGRLPLLHADAYRLNANEIEAIGFEEAVETWPGVILIEWAGKVVSSLPDDHLFMELIHREAGRLARVDATGVLHAAILDKWRTDFGQ